MSASVLSSWLYEKRPMKRPKLGPPDVYPQDPKQKEDELTAVNVKQGFLTSPLIQDEYGSARNTNITPNKFGSSFSALLSKKQELNTLQDTARKKQQINTKDNIWLVTARSKNAVDAWFKDLSCGAKTLSQLSRKVPIFNKKEEIFTQLYEFQVPMFKAQWFVKMSCAYQIALSEANNKSKKRQLPDSSQEWTAALCRFLREQYQKLCEHYHGVIMGTSSSATSVLTSSSISGESVQNQWQYYTQFARHLFEEGLLDRYDFLTWLLDLLEKVKSPDDSVIRIVISLILQYVDDFTQSELLSRKLAYHCAKKLSQLINDYNGMNNIQNVINNDTKGSSSVPSPLNTDTESSSKANTCTSNSSSSNSLPSTDPIVSCFTELLNCSHHRNVILGLSSIIQIITLECPTALVWHNITEGKNSTAHHGSPLDHLPCAPSSLPMPQKPHNQYLRYELRRAEEQIRERSKLSEMNWSYDQSQHSAGTIVTRLLGVLEALDRHCFDKIDSTNSLDVLYSKIFFNSNINTSPPSSSSISNSSSATNGNVEPLTRNITEMIADDEPIVKLLCEWAVTTKRTGEHRALVVSKLLEKRQNELTAEKENETMEETETETVNNNNNNNNTQNNVNNEKSPEPTVSLPIYQNLLLSFLDTQAPVYDGNSVSNAERKHAFSNLILLFGELMRYDVFSHDLYMSTLISRGQFANSPCSSLIINGPIKSNAPEEPSSLAGFVPNLSSAPDLQSLSGNSHLGGIDPSGVQKSTSGSSLPMFDPVSNHSVSGQHDQLRWDMAPDIEDVDTDLDKLLQQIKAGQQNMNDQADILLPDSVGSDKEDEPVGVLGGQSSFSSNEPSTKSTIARHLLYTMHFPLPQDESSLHDCNQRHILLYGVGKERDEARHTVKKITKEISKLFNRRSSMDISDGGKVKKHAIKEGFNFDSAINKFQSLSTFDQHVVITSCANAAIEMLNGVAMGNANYLPLIESIAFLFDLMEMALYVHGLIEFVVQMLKELVEVDIQLHQKCPILARTYCTSIGLYIVGVLYRYQTCLLVLNEDTSTVFEGLWKIVRHVSTPTDCTSAERCILYYLYDLYSSYNHLRTKYHDTVSTMFSKIKAMNSPTIQLPTPDMRWNNACMMEYLRNPKLKVDAIHIRQLNERSSERYSFVCNAIQCVSLATDIDRLNEISVLCAELTSSCSALSIEWLCVLKALCCSSNHNCGFYDLLTSVDVSDLSIHDNLAVFTSILIARRCFSLKDFLMNVAVPSLLAPCSDGAEDAESGARLTCHLLLCLFKTSDAPLSSTTMATFATTSRYSLTSPGPSVLSTTPPNPGQRPHYIIKYPCDRYLLTAAHSTLRVEVVLTVLKAILVLGNSTEKKGSDGKPKTDGKGEISISDILGPLGGDDDFGDISGLVTFPNKSGTPRMESMHEKAGLSESAKYALRQICGQQWVHDRCLRGFMIDTEMLSKLLIDSKMSHKEAQHLLNMICHPKSIGTCALQDKEMDQKQTIAKILKKLDEWTMRVSWLQLQLMYAQCSSQSNSEVGSLLDNVAKATIDFFQNASEESSKVLLQSSNTSMFSPKSGSKGSSTPKHTSHSNESNNMCAHKDRVWLIAPLISKLHNTVQGKILRVAANVLEAGNWISNGISQSQSSYSASNSKNKDRGFQQQKNTSNSSSNSTSSLLSHQPFLSLVLMCLKGQDDQRESLLNSLYSQLSQALNDKIIEDIKAKQSIQEGLQLRLSLVGGMFDTIQRSTSLTNDWAVLLLQLISFTVVDPQLNDELFTTVLDMLSVLIHTTQVSDSSEPREETKKQYQNLIKKLKKELTSERITVGIKMVRQLLPIVKQQCEVITCEPMGSLIDTKGNKIAGFDSIDKKQGLQVAEKQKVSPWDLLEGHKNPSPLSWTWFGAVRIERKPLRGDENHYLLSRHNHSLLKRSTQYYIDPPPLPPEDVIEQNQVPPPNVLPQINNERNIPMVQHPPQMIPNAGMQPMVIDDQLRRDIPISLETSPRAATPKKTKGPRKRRTPKNAQNNIANNGQHTPPIRMPYESFGGPPPNQQGPQTWYGAPQQSVHAPNAPVQTQQSYYNPPPPQQQQMTRFTDQRGSSKSAIRAMLGLRHPPNPSQFNMQQPPNANVVPPQQQTMIGPPVNNQNVYQGRQMMMQQRQMRTPQPQQMGAPQTAMYQMQPSMQQSMQPSNQGPGPTPPHHMTVQPQANYGAPPPNMPYGNTMQNQMQNQMQSQMHMQNVDQSMGGPPSGAIPGYHNAPQQNQMVNVNQMRAQLQQQQPQMQQQQQFIAQRSQYGAMQTPPNVTMSQMGPGPMDSRGNMYNQQQGAMQSMQQQAPHMNPQQWQQSAPRPQQQNPALITQLQRQLSGNAPQHNPYHHSQGHY